MGYAVDHQKNVQKWISEGSFKAEQSITQGIDNAAEGLLGLFKGTNFGKAVLEVSKLQKKRQRRRNGTGACAENFCSKSLCHHNVYPLQRICFFSFENENSCFRWRGGMWKWPYE